MLVDVMVHGLRTYFQKTSVVLKTVEMQNL
jgi:hypothetical protein